ncbi:copper resistance D family protein [Microbacterium sp. NIBRBAC000506063]|uniref:copper resistance D family protein n=1 Tax=Microbacterium sp. NIBRBAC000506063 TaxID=2734618 RepID=UPI002948C3F3|nr:CopD family protein [Microbacterium sp. NIBRBAC000506063]
MGPSRALRVLGPAILLVSALVALLVALNVGGGAAPLPLQDPGAFVRWALPVAKLVTNLSAALMIGPLVLALFTLRPGERPFEQALNAASVGAALFTVAAATTVFLTFMSIFNPQLSAEREFGAQLGRFLFELPIGQAWVIAVILGAIVTLLLFAWRTWTPVLLTTVLAMATLLPIATTGHSGDLSGHGLAVNSILLHMVAAAVWLGGLLLLVLLRGGGSVVDEPILRRYSSIALAAFVVVAASGLARSFVALETWADLWTPYGAILIAKIALLTGLGAFGVWYRMRLIPQIASRSRSLSEAGRSPAESKGAQSTASAWFWRLVGAELALMGLASGRPRRSGAPPPGGDEVPAMRTPAELLMGEPVPPELTPIRWVTMWDVDILWLLGGLFGIFFYLAAVWRLRRRGHSWPVHRTVLWVVGLLALIWVTSGSINLYQDFLFSVHMLGHMLLGWDPAAAGGRGAHHPGAARDPQA